MGEEIEKFKRHCGEATEVEIKGDKFSFKPLPSKYLPYFIEIQQHLMRKKKELGEDKESAFINAPKEVIKNLVYLAEETVKCSYPKLQEDVANQFVAENFGVLLPMVLKINLGMKGEVNEIKPETS